MNASQKPTQRLDGRADAILLAERLASLLLGDGAASESELVVDFGGALADSGLCRNANVRVLAATGGRKKKNDQSEIIRVDFSSRAAVKKALASIALDRRVSAIVISDPALTGRHGANILAAATEFAATRSCAVVAAVANAAHDAIALPLIFGVESDPEATALRSIAMSHRDLAAAAEAVGLVEVGATDIAELTPDGAPAIIGRGALAHQFLQDLRAGSQAHASTKYFVRAYRPRPIEAPAATGASPAPFLTVGVRTQGSRSDTLRETLLCLAAQTSQDFEVILLVHNASAQQLKDVREIVAQQSPSLKERIRLVEVASRSRTTPLNRCFEEARGDYVSFFDDDDLVFAH